MVSSVDAISSSDSIDNELTRKSLSMLLLFGETLYQFNRNETKIPSKATFHVRSNNTKGIKIIPSACVSNSIKNRIFEIFGKIKSKSAAW
jgi:hypothetical protein